MDRRPHRDAQAHFPCSEGFSRFGRCLCDYRVCLEWTVGVLRAKLRAISTYKSWSGLYQSDQKDSDSLQLLKSLASFPPAQPGILPIARKRRKKMVRPVLGFGVSIAGLVVVSQQGVGVIAEQASIPAPASGGRLTATASFRSA